MLYVQADNYDEAIENIDVDEAIEEAAKTNTTTIEFEYGYNKYYEYKGSEDCDWIPLGGGDVDLSDLDIGVDELLDYIRGTCL